MNGLIRITRQNLPTLSRIYKQQDYPQHAASFTAVEHFIHRFDKKPQWEEKVIFWTFNDSWEKNGTFAMINENDRHITFDTLEPWPYTTLQKTLERLEIVDEMVFISIRDIFRPMLEDVLRVQNLEKTFDSGMKLVWSQAKLFKDVKIKAPDGFHFDFLGLQHVDKINAVWAQKYSRSHEYLATVIQENPCTGLFTNESKELVAWCLMLETGGLGNLQVDEKYLRNNIGAAIALYQIKKYVQTYNRDILGFIAHHNKVSFNMFGKIGGEWIGNLSFVGVKEKKQSKMTPLWGRP